MVYPNADAAAFSNWMLYTSWQTLTPSLTALIAAINTAALAGNSVTDQQWINFTQATAWRRTFYDAWVIGNTPRSAIPVGTCDFWLSSQYLTYNTAGPTGTVRATGPVQTLLDLNGGAVTAANANNGREPFLVVDNSRTIAKQLFGFNTTGLSSFILSNAGALVQNKTAYTVFLVAKATAYSTTPCAFYFSAGATVSKERISLNVNTSGNWLAKATRLDADTAGTCTGSAATGLLQIICFTMDYSTGQGNIYVNGVLKGTTNGMTTTGSTSNTASSTVAIATLNSAQIFTGLISDVLGFKTALSAANVLTLSDWLNSMRACY